MRVGFVVQRCGAEVNGGAETLCLQIAQRMTRHWDVEVLTTCALEYMRWENHYPEGEENIGGVTIRRFAVDLPRNVADFDRLSGELLAKGAGATLEQQEEWMRAQGPLSSRLLEHLKSRSAEYDGFIFFGYLYATTYFGLPLVKEKAYLAPLGHDEWPIHLSMWDALFAIPRGFVFQTPEEREFLQKRFPHLVLAGPVAGIGIEIPPQLAPEKFRQTYQLGDPFLLYVGRIDASKGCAALFAWFQERAQGSGQRYKLILTGREVLPVPFHDDIIYLGFVSEEEKWNAMAACDWLIMPSEYESLSISLLETWGAARPALVNGKSAVLAGHCRRSHGGLWFDDWNECEAALRLVDQETKATLGTQGQDYVRTRYSWERIETDYLRTLDPCQVNNRDRDVASRLGKDGWNS